MPLKLTISISRKIGQPNCGSRGATVGLELQAESSLLDAPGQFHERIVGLFRLAEEAVDHNLANGGRRMLATTAAPSAIGLALPPRPKFVRFMPLPDARTSIYWPSSATDSASAAPSTFHWRRLAS